MGQGIAIMLPSYCQMSGLYHQCYILILGKMSNTGEYRGYIHLIFSAPTGNARADQILEDYQREAAEGNLKFRRWPMRAVRTLYSSSDNVLI